ncbi:MAG: hypothetical protein K2P42_19075 [Lachnospiraceae bacterium]|nr:hypothetical protein [Lachnospiraceae bacterium]
MSILHATTGIAAMLAMSFRRLTKAGFNVRLLLGLEAETYVAGRQSILEPVIEIYTDFRNCYMHDSSVYDRSMR